MENREAGLQVLYNRIKDERRSLGIKTFRRTPSKPVEEKHLVCVFMSEGIDRITKPNSRNWLGYPARRELEVIFELVALSDYDIRDLYTKFRRVALSDPILVEDCIVRESRTIGPQGYSLPNVIGLQLILSMAYTDNGIQV